MHVKCFVEVERRAGRVTESPPVSIITFTGIFSNYHIMLIELIIILLIIIEYINTILSAAIRYTLRYDACQNTLFVTHN